MQRNIKLVKYRKYNNGLILFEHINTPIVNPQSEPLSNTTQKTHIEKLAGATNHFKTLYASLCDYIESLGDDLVPNQLKLYLAYKKYKTFSVLKYITSRLFSA